MAKLRRPLITALVIGGLLLLSACMAARVMREERGLHGGRAGGVRHQQQAAVQPITRSAAGGLESQSIDVGGMRRDFLVHVPAGLGAQAPMVLAFHGGGGGAEGFGTRTGLVEAADRMGFILVLPEGVRGSWNTGGQEKVGYSSRANLDDVGFVAGVIDTMLASYPVDPGRVYAAGMSAGGMLTYRLACELPGRFSAVAVVAGTMDTVSCPGVQNVSLLHIHGTNDQNVPFEGGAGQLSADAASYPPVMTGIQTFKAGDQCTSGASTTTRPAQDTSCEISSCSDGETVELCTVQGGGHAWPGIPAARWQQRNDVYVSPYFNATDYVTQFLLSH